MSLIPNLLPVLLMALSGVGFLGCATGPQMSLSNWEGTELKAVRMVSGGQVVTLPENPPITLKLDAGGKVSGRSAVNRYFGSFTTASDGTIIWNGALGATRMAGPPEAMQL